MLSSKLKLWVETHLTRSGKKKSKSKKAQTTKGDRIASSPMSMNNCEAEKNHSSLSFPVPNSGGRSNAGLVIQLQHDIATNPCWKTSQLASSPLISWKNERQELLNKKDEEEYTRELHSGLETSSARDTIFSQTSSGFSRQSSSDSSTTKSLQKSSSSLEPKFPLSRKTASNLSSPESAYSTGCSTDISPVQDAGPESHEDPNKIGWDFQSRLHDLEKTPFSPRPRSAIRTNPWVPLKKYPQSRLSSGDSGTETSSGNFTESDSRSSRHLSQSLLYSVKETDILSDGDAKNDVVDAADSTQPCDSFELLMEDDQLQVITKQVSEAYQSWNNTDENKSSAKKKQSKPWDKDIDDRYTALIKETEEILNQLENDELFLLNRVQENQAEIRRKALHYRPPRYNRGKRNSGRRLNRPTVEISSSDSEETDYRESPEAPLRFPFSRPKYNSRRRDRAKQVHEGIFVNHFAGQNALTRTLSYRRAELPEETRPPSPAPMDITLSQSEYRVSQCPRSRYRRGQRQAATYLDNKTYLEQASRHTSSCPGSPATYLRDDYQLPRGWRYQSDPDVDDLVRHDSYYNSEHFGMYENEFQSDWREQKRLEAEVAFLQQQLLRDSSECSLNDIVADHVGNSSGGSFGNPYCQEFNYVRAQLKSGYPGKPLTVRPV